MTRANLTAAAAGFLIGAAIYPTFNPSLMLAGIALWLSVTPAVAKLDKGAGGHA